MPLEIRIYNQTGTNDNSVQLLSVDTGTTISNAYYVYYTNSSGTNPIINRVNGVNGTAISTNFTNLPSFTDSTGKSYRQLFAQYAESGTLWFALTTNNWTTNTSNPAPTGGPGVPWSDAAFGDIEYAYMGSPYDTADATAINTVGIPMLLQLCTNVNSPVPGYVKGFTNTNSIPSMLANMGEISSAAWFGAAPNTNLIRFIGPSSAATGIQMSPGGSTNSNPLYSGGWPGQIAPSFAPYLYKLSLSTPIGTGAGGYKIFARISNSIGLNPKPGTDPGTNDYFYWFSFDVTLTNTPGAPAPTAAQLNWLNGVSTASNTPYYWTPTVILTNGVIVASNKNSGIVTTNTGLGARYTPDQGAATNSWFSSYIYGAPATYSAPNPSGTNTGYVTLLPSVATWSNIATANGFSYHSSWAPSIQDSMLNEIAFGFAGGFVMSPVQGWPVWLDSQGDLVPPGGAAPAKPNTNVPQTNIGAMPSCSWWVQTTVYAENQTNSPPLTNNPWYSAWGQSIYQASKVVYSHAISDRMKNTNFSPGLPLLLAHTNTNFPPSNVQPWLEIYLYNPNSAGTSSQVPVITSSTNAIRLTNTPTGVVFSNNSGDPFYQITADNGPQGFDTAALPPGLKFDPYTQKIYGTIPPQTQIPPFLNLNPYIIQLFAYNQNGVGTKELPLYVSSPANTAKPADISPSGTVKGSSFIDYQLASPLARFSSAQNAPPFRFILANTPALPGGLVFTNLTNNGLVNGYLIGTATNNGNFGPYTVVASNSFGTATSTFSIQLIQGVGNTNIPSNFTPTVLAGPAGGPAAPISLDSDFGPVILTGSNLVGATWSLAADSDPVPPGVQWSTNLAASGEVFGKVWSSGGVKNSTQGVLKFSVANNFGVATNPIGFKFGTPNSNKCTFTSYTITGTEGNQQISPAGLGAFPLNINSGTQFNLSNSLEAVWTPPTNLPAGLTFSTQTQSGGNAGQVWATVSGTPSGNTLNPQTFQTNTNTVNFVISNNVGVQTNTLSFIIAPSTPPPSGAPSVNNLTTNVNQYQWVYIEPSGTNLNYATWSSTNTSATLPPGSVFYTNLALSSTRLGGILAGQVTNAGTYVVGFVATNPFGASTGNITITVTAASNPSNKPMFSSFPPMTYTGNVASNTPVINPNDNPTFPVRIQVESFLSNQPAVITASGLPPGLTLTNWPTSSGMSAQFVGTPTAPGTFTVPVTASNAAGTTISNAVFTIQGAAALPSITSAGTASGQSGVAFTFQLTANNGPVGYGAQNLPTWLTLNSNAPAAGLIHGTPPATFQGTLPNIKVWATNAGGSGPTSNLSITITEPSVPAISSPGTATATNGQAFSYQITASGFPLSFGAQGLPGWATLNDNTGLITGTPPAAGPNAVTQVLLTAANSAGIGHATLSLTNTNPPTPRPFITSASSTQGTVGQPFNFLITATESPTSYGITPALPAGLSLNTATGLISGTPTSSGNTAYTVSASNAGGTGTGQLSILITPPPAPVITSAGTATATSGTAFIYTITTSGGTPTSYGATGLPAWASLDSATGVITGTPGLLDVGITSAVGLTAANTTGTGRKNLTLTVGYDPTVTAPGITSSGTASGTVGQAFNFPETASGSPSLWTITPPLGDGLSFNGTTGDITGTPESAGTYQFTVKAYNNGGAGAQPLSLTFTSPLTVPFITSPANATATNGRVFTYRITATENPTSYAASNRPAWLGAPNAQGVMSGTPTGTGSASLVLYASNAAGKGHAPLALSVVVNPSVRAPTITSASSAAGTAGQNFAFAFKASGGTPITWSIAPALPGNLSLSASGAVSGTPQSAGTNSYTVTASNTGGTATQTWTLAVASVTPPVINSPATAAGKVGTAFNYKITASGNPSRYAASNLPAGLSVNATSGVISGRPTVAGTNQVTLYASNAAGLGHGNLTLTVAGTTAAPVITSAGTATATQGVAFSYRIIASGKPTSYGASPLPPNLSVNAASGQISGTPASVGTSTVLLSASNATGVGTKALTLTVLKKGAVPTITSANTATGKVSQNFRYQITASGKPTSYSATDLPLGLSINTKSGLISGKPTRAGTNNVILTASNTFGAGSAQLLLTVQENTALPVITSASVASGQQYADFSYTITATGNPRSYGATGLPGGLSVNASSGVISGVPTVSGRFTVTLSAVNGAGTGTARLNLIIDQAPPVDAQITSSLATVTVMVGSSYSYTVTANNGPTQFTATGLPPGLRLNATTGVISGKPTKGGDYAVTLQAVHRVTGEPVTTASGTKVFLIRPFGNKTIPANAW